MTLQGHLFVVQADLSRIAADAFLIPCDSDVNVSGGWRPFVEPGSEPRPSWDWFRPEGVTLTDGLAFLTDPPAPPNEPDDTGKQHTRMPDDVVGLRVLVDTVGEATIPAMVDRSISAVTLAAAKARRHGARSLPLVALPILGVGQGNFPGRRAEVVRELVGRLHAFVATHPIDVALVLQRTSDYAAAQWARKLADDTGVEGWSALSDEQRTLADQLGEAAGRGELSVFAGAGVSKPVGLPDWKELLTELAGRELTFDDDTDYPKLAQDLGIKDLNKKVAARFRTRKHALGHALLADLRTRAMVTTNYDPCLENAAAVIHVDPPLQVLARQLAVGGHPWLLKLHGDLEAPDTIVLTSDQYERLETEHRALRGLVQSLMLTSHLLFVGFGFADSDFLAMSEAVAKVRELAVDEHQGTKVGTAVELRESSERKHEQLAYHHLAPPTVTYHPQRDYWKSCSIASPGGAKSPATDAGRTSSIPTTPRMRPRMMKRCAGPCSSYRRPWRRTRRVQGMRPSRVCCGVLVCAADFCMLLSRGLQEPNVPVIGSPWNGTRFRSTESHCTPIRRTTHR